MRNGSIGTVVEVRDDAVVVNFERWGFVAVPWAYVERKVSGVVGGGLQHAYALTTHAAQGETFAVAAPLFTDASCAEGAYVAITRGQFDFRAVVIRQRDLVARAPGNEAPMLRDETSALIATKRRLSESIVEQCVSDYEIANRLHHRDFDAAAVIEPLDDGDSDTRTASAKFISRDEIRIGPVIGGS